MPEVSWKKLGGKYNTVLWIFNPSNKGFFAVYRYGYLYGSYYWGNYINSYGTMKNLNVLAAKPRLGFVIDDPNIIGFIFNPSIKTMVENNVPNPEEAQPEIISLNPVKLTTKTLNYDLSRCREFNKLYGYNIKCQPSYDITAYEFEKLQ